MLGVAALALATILQSAGGFLRQQQPAPPQEPEPQTPVQHPPPPGLLPLQVVAEIDPWAASPNGKKPRPKAPALLDRGRLVFTTDSGEAWCIDADTGAFLWKLGFPGATLLPPSSAPTGIVLAGSEGHLLVVEPDHGETLLDLASDFPVALPPLAHGGVFYLASPEGEVGAFDPEEKRFRWRTATGEAVRAVAAGAGLLVASGGEGTLTALAAEDGKVRWTFRAQGGFEAPAVFDPKEERLFVGDASGAFYSLSADEGKQRYRWRTGAAINVPALVHDRRVYVASQANILFAYTEGGGHELWRVNLPGRPATGPVAAGPFIAVATLTGDVVEFHATSAKRGGTPYRAPADIRAPPTIAPPRVAVVLRSGKVFLLATGNPPLPQTPAILALTTPASFSTPSAIRGSFSLP